MLIEEIRWNRDAGWTSQSGTRDDAADLVLYFGSRSVLDDTARYDELRLAYPRAKIVGCSATRSIAGDSLEDDVLVAAAVRFRRTPVRIAHARVMEPAQSRSAGEAIGTTLGASDLCAVFLLADGLRVDGSNLTAGLSDAVGSKPLVFGGMASDPRDYQAVLVGADCAPQSGSVAAVGFYGDALRFAHGSASGWDPFGPRRRVTRSDGNVLYDLDGRPASELYQRYLGDQITLGSSDGVIFPLQISPPEHPERTLIRAPLIIAEGPESMTFAGHVPEGWIARLTRGNADRLILAAVDAARGAGLAQMQAGSGDSLSLIVSCAGRHQLMGQRTEEELEVVGAELGSDAKRIGFYSFGEIAPVAHTGMSDVHNQTISITSLTEIA